MRTKILMVYPEIPDTFWNYKVFLPILGKKAMFPPLGLLTIASLIPDRYEIKLIDMNVHPLKRIDIEQADLVFISAMGVQQESFVEVVDLCSEYSKTMVAGGPLIWSAYDLGVLNIDRIQHLVINEAETLLPQFIRDYENGTARSIYSTSEKPDLAASPIPRFDLVDLDDYAMVPVQYSRGCPFQCEFCDIIEMNGRRVRTKSPSQFLSELDVIFEQGHRGEVFIVDDNFIGHLTRTKILLKKLLEWQRERDFPFSFITQVSINVAHDDEMLDLMSEVNFRMLFIGIETPDTSTLAAIQKIQNTREDMIECIKKIQARRIMVMGGFIIGFDTDNDTIFDMQIDFIQSAGIPIAMVGLLGAVPNTQLYRRLRRENRLIGNGWHTFNNIDLCLNFVPRMPERIVIEGYKKVMAEIYSPRRWFERTLKMLEHFSQDPPPRKMRLFKDDATLMHKLRCISRGLSFFTEQIFSFYGFEYLKFIVKAWKTNRANFLAAVALAAAFPHYYGIARKIAESNYFYRDSSKDCRIAMTGGKIAI